MNRNQRQEVRFDIVERIAVLNGENGGWTKELNMVSWNDNEPKYDIRSWNEDHTKMSRGLTLTEDETSILVEALRDVFKDELDEDEEEPAEGENDGSEEPESAEDTPEEPDEPEDEPMEPEKILNEDVVKDGVVKITHLNPGESVGIMELDVAKFIENRPLRDIGDFVRKIVKTASNRSDIISPIIAITRKLVLDNAAQSSKREKDIYKRGSRLLELIAPLA